MCDRARPLAPGPCRALRTLGMVVALTGVAAPWALGAQRSTVRSPALQTLAAEASALKALLDRSRMVAKAAEETLEARRQEIVDRRDRRIEAGGRRVRYSKEELTDADTTAIAEGLRRTRARLLQRFGASGLALLDDAEWMASARKRSGRLVSFGEPSIPSVRLRTSVRADAIYDNLNSPVNPADVERFALRVAGDRLTVLAPSLAPFAGGSTSFASEEGRWAEAAREMALSWASAGRRCVVGAVSACEAVMTLRRRGGPMPAWLDPSDTRAAVTVGELPPTADSASIADRKRCLRGAVELCAVVLSRVKIPDPFGASLRGTLVMHAIDLGGAEALSRAATAPDTAPLALLAHVAGVSADSLLKSWQTRTSLSLVEARGSSIPLGLSTVAWCALVLVGTTRRRP